MPIYKPTELQAFLIQLGIDPKSRFSQNFLIDGNIVQKILMIASVAPGDFVIEIGPGPGSLTEALLGAQAEVIAIEKDPLLAKALTRLNGNLTVICEDILKTDIAEFCRAKKAKVIANLPYHITSPILTKLVSMHAYISSLTLMVQEEVARRLTATCGQPGYGYMNLFLQFYSSIQYVFKVKRSCFYPAPRVDSAMITLDLKKPEEDINAEDFLQFVAAAFRMRRKTIKKSLQKLFPHIEEALFKAKIDPKLRPEQLKLEDFLALFRALQS